MSIYTEETLPLAVFESLRSRGVPADSSLIPRIRVLIPSALELLSDRVKEGKDYAKGQKDYAITPVAGVIDLIAPAFILFDFNKASVRVSATNVFLEPIDDLWTLQNGDLPTDVSYYAEEGRTLRVRSVTTGLLTDYIAPVKVKSNYVFSLTDAARPLPDYFDGALVNTLVGMCMANPVESIEQAA